MKIKRIAIHIIFVIGLVLCCFACKKDKSNTEPEFALSSSILNNDSIWIKTYQKFNNEVLRPQIMEVFKSVSDSVSLQMADIGLFNMLVQNYDCNNLKVSDFQTKYPFAKTEFVEGNFNQLVSKGLLERNEGVFKLTNTGKALLKDLKKNYQKVDDSQIDSSALALLNKVSKEALSSEFKGINKSLKNCQKASLRFDDSNNNFLRLLTVMNDLVALRNDQSHYRYSFLKDKPFNFEEELNHPMIELLAGISYNQSFNPKGYLSRPTWGYSEAETNGFLDFLRDKKLIVKKDSLYELTEVAKNIEERVSEESEWHFYQPWLFMSKKEYQKYKALLQ